VSTDTLLPAQAGTATPVLSVRNLDVAYGDRGRETRVVHGISFDVAPGEVVALVGESGSGKTTTAQAVIGLLAENGRVEGGAIRLNGEEIGGWSQKRLDAIRGLRISLVPQDPGSSLNPVKTIGDQVEEILRIHGRGDRASRKARVIELLTKVGLSNPELRAGQYPHELSGGMKQRVLIAIAIALEPALIIADEPTSALDVTVQRRILDLIDGLRREFGTAILLVTHDLGVAADRADRIVVLQHGRIQEQGATADILAAPQNAYTRQLLADAPSVGEVRTRKTLSSAGRGRVGEADRVRGSDLSAECGAPSPCPLPAGERVHVESATSECAIRVENLVRDFPQGGARGAEKFRAVDGFSFDVPRGTTHAIVGESGSGKTTTVRAVVGFERPSAGRILVDGVDIAGLRGEAMRRMRRTIQLVYQNPFSSLDPRQSIFSIIEEPLLNFEPVAREERKRRVHDILARVGLPDAALERRPAALSGGQRQRVAIARALILEPKILVLDEAVSALDVTVQAQILRLLGELQADLGLTYLFVSHDLAVVRQISDTVSVLKDGRLVESGTIEEVFDHPREAYTQDLIAAIPGRGRAPVEASP
jgi:peptide/nickel transport system ATP-binding protein